ncbi:hypothetical protein RvY_02183 [Ramazzottius varieornatus]|uniref:Alpha-1,4-N-acetylglucosaminyltransferase n=1 Tax=Ramazzottius varieornatus TaxID=947166 RepID=A0A1D1UMK9_RAMVA|nr:hypothetical protein RvY_02183 [Ramazzottius varieornatus]
MGGLMFRVVLLIHIQCLGLAAAPIVLYRRRELRPSNQANKTALLENLIAHYVRLIPEGPAVSRPPVQSPFNFRNHTLNELNFLDCMSILSVQVNLRPASIYIHTNIPRSSGHWPNTSCNRWITDWSNLHLIPINLKHTTAGQKIKDIQHEADIAKLEAVYKYGGLALDFDVYILNGELLRHKLATTPCLSCHEDPGEGNDKINAGFLGCLEPHAEFPGRVLDVYKKDFRPNEWVYNSGEQPFWIMVEHPHIVTLDDNVCVEPEWLNRHMELYENNKWQNMTAYHSYFHMFPGAFNQEDFERTQIILLSDMIRWFAAKVGIHIPINYA